MAFSTARRARVRRFSSTGYSVPPASIDSRSRTMARSASSSAMPSSRRLDVLELACHGRRVCQAGLTGPAAGQRGAGRCGEGVDGARIRRWSSPTLNGFHTITSRAGRGGPCRTTSAASGPVAVDGALEQAGRRTARSSSASSSAVGAACSRIDEPLPDPPERVVVAPEAEDLVDGGRRTPSVISTRSRSSAATRPRVTTSSRMKRAKPCQNVPPGTSSSTIGRGLGLAGLLEGEQLERLVERAEPAGHRHEALRLLHQHQLAGEEVLHRHVLRVVGDDVVGAGLERQADAHADGLGRRRRPPWRPA